MIDQRLPGDTPAREHYIERWKARYSGDKLGVLFLGAGPLQIPGLSVARRMGLRLFVADGNSRAAGSELADEFLPIDLKDIDALAKAATSLAAAGRIHGVLTIGTDFSASVAYAAEAAGLPGIGYENALNASRKERMRRVFHKAGLPNPGSVVLTAETPSPLRTVEEGGLNFPVVAKPSDNMGARGVSEAASPEELDTALKAAFAHARNGIVVVEEKIIGAEYSLDSLIDDGKLYPMGIARRHIDYPPYFIERGHSFPSGLSDAQEAEMFAVLRRAAESLGIRCGAAKGDIFYTENGPVIGEVAARLSGGFMSGWTFPLHSGIDPAVGAIQLSLGQALVQDFDGGYFASSTDPAVQRREVHERGVISMPGIVEELTVPRGCDPSWFFPSAAPGDEVRFPRNNVEKCGNFIAAADAATVQAAISRSLVKLRAVSAEDLSSRLREPFPPAFPRALDLLASRSSDSIPAASGGSAVPASRPVPAELLAADERDWNYRSISDSLELLREMHGGFTWRRADWKALSLKDRDFLWCLLRGGIQGAGYYLELETENSEKEIGPPGIVPGD
jgi:biotin carboxylase